MDQISSTVHVYIVINYFFVVTGYIL